MNTIANASAHTSFTATTQAKNTSSVLQNATELSGRVLLSSIFLISGVGKISAYAATAGYMAAFGVPALLLPLVIATEVLGGLALLAGWQTRITAFLLAGFTMVAALIFHNQLSDQMQMIMFLKNFTIAGGLLLAVVHGAGAWSMDRQWNKSYS